MTKSADYTIMGATMTSMDLPTMDTQHSARLDELESRLMMQEHTIEELNEVITRQNLEMAALKSLLQRVQGQVTQLMPLLQNKPGDEKPPHY